MAAKVKNPEKNSDWEMVNDNMKPDTRRRVSLPSSAVVEGVTYRVYRNSIGQILLDPQVTIPASELWLFENKDALDSLDRGMIELRNGQTIKRGSFAKYVKDES